MTILDDLNPKIESKIPKQSSDFDLEKFDPQFCRDCFFTRALSSMMDEFM